MPHPAPSLSRRAFVFLLKKLCILTMRVFYRNYQVSGAEKIPDDAGVILCVNHVNALIDAAVLQASTQKNIRALARDGLFKNPFLKPILNMIGTVPIYRRETESSDTSKNQDTFARCYELLVQNQTLVIFPEGQSHSKSNIQDLKTGAARMALGAIKANGIEPVVLPVGMTFHRQKRLRTEVLVRYGDPVDLSVPENTTEYDAVHLITDRVKQGMEAVTLNTDSWDDLKLAKRLEQFFTLRKTKQSTVHSDGEGHKKANLSLAERFNSLQQLIAVQDLLKEHEPEKVRSLMSKLRVFEKLCDACGISTYHLSVSYRPLLLVLYTMRTLGVVLLGFPIAIWGLVNSILPYTLTHFFTQKITKKVDQHDTTWVLLGMLIFGLFWGLQCNYVFRYYGLQWSVFYLLSIVLGSGTALKLRGEYKRTIANLKVFFLFMRKNDLRSYLEKKRYELEVELAQMVKIAKRLAKNNKKQMP